MAEINTKSGKVVVKVQKTEDGRIAEIFEVNMPKSIKHLGFNEFIKWCYTNENSSLYSITYESSKFNMELPEWLQIQKSLKFINDQGKIIRQ